MIFANDCKIMCLQYVFLKSKDPIIFYNILMNTIDVENFLARIEPFKNLNSSDLKQMVSRAQSRAFTKGEFLFSEDQAADYVWVLLSGRVQILKYTSQGHSFAVESLGAGELLGTLCRIGKESAHYPCTATASQKVQALAIPSALFFKFYKENDLLMRGLCVMCSDRLQDMQNLRRLDQEPVSTRVSAVLHRLYKVHGSLLPFTKKEIAELAGTTVETTFRVLAALQKKGALKSLRGKIQINDISAI